MIEMTSIFITLCMEVMITIERVISSVNPERYYNNDKLAWKILIPCSIITMIFSIIINTFATRYCKRRGVELQGKCSLNARYQVKESSDMASAMQYAFLISIIMKVNVITQTLPCSSNQILENSVNSIFLLFCFDVDSSTNTCVPLMFETHWGILETLYSMNISLNGGFMILWLMSNHPRLRRNAVRLL
ncbi:hypothetical protein PFISCL1PPCAC_14535, partial [Pristionchus fissidentatus]